MSAAYLRLDGRLLHQSVDTLRARVAERFPHAGLTKVATAIADAAAAAPARAAATARPNYKLRVAVGLLLALMLGCVVTVAAQLRVKHEEVRNATTFAQFLEAALAIVVMLGGGAAYLVGLETRLKRWQTLAALRELRALAHLIDMHQLAKSPDHYLPEAAPTEHSPARRYSPYELGRYLDYCAELLAMVGKIAVVHAAETTDPVTLDAVDQIEDLTNSLARKVWQKLALLNAVVGEHAVRLPPLVPPAEPPAAA